MSVLRHNCVDKVDRFDILLHCMTIISRNTQVVSISLQKNVAQKLDDIRKQRGQSRSALVSWLIEKELENQRWERIYRKGEQTAKTLKITSEEDIDRLLHAP